MVPPKAGTCVGPHASCELEDPPTLAQLLASKLASDAPAGYAPVSVQQILTAHSELFLLASKEINQVRAEAGGRMQVDEAILRLWTDPRVTMHLLPLPRGMAASVKMDDANPPTVFAGLERPTKKRKTLKKGFLAAPKTEGMPEEMKQCPHYTAHDGRRLCWGFNCDGCNLPTDGKSPPACRKGVRACAVCRKPGRGAKSCWHWRGKGAGKGQESLQGPNRWGGQGVTHSGCSCSFHCPRKLRLTKQR